MPKLGQDLRSLRERSGWSAEFVAQLAALSPQTIYAVENNDANWSSAVAYAAAVGRRLLFHAPRSRKQTAETIARTTGMSVNTVVRLMALTARPDAIDLDVHLESLQRYLDAIGGYVLVRK